ncbi:MAG: hypothetical protein KAS30_05705 [Candidatus Diapherotrites archaeon]|nr:hypothetical protein [Candidatus Diapherotrites archaeon]
MGSVVYIKGCSKIDGIGLVFVGIVKDGFFGSGMHATVDGSHIIVDRVEYLENKNEIKPEEKKQEDKNQKQPQKHVFFTLRKTGVVIPSVLKEKTILFQNTEDPYRKTLRREF